MQIPTMLKSLRDAGGLKRHWHVGPQGIQDLPEDDGTAGLTSGSRGQHARWGPEVHGIWDQRALQLQEVEGLWVGFVAQLL